MGTEVRFAYLSKSWEQSAIRYFYPPELANRSLLQTPSSFLPTWWYSDSTTRAEIHYLSDLSYAVKNPDFIPEYALTLEQPFGAPKFDDYKEFLSTHREFLLYCVGMPRLEWIKDRLIHEGWNVVLIRSEGSKKIYRVTKPDS